jgi:hypothetical protein
MITILKNEKNNIIYECDCGVKGKCMVKPREEDATIVVNVSCPICLDTIRVFIKQYKDNLTIPEISWSPIIANEIIEYSLKKEKE